MATGNTFHTILLSLGSVKAREFPKSVGVYPSSSELLVTIFIKKKIM
jgi:hypothetical protein